MGYKLMPRLRRVYNWVGKEHSCDISSGINVRVAIIGWRDGRVRGDQTLYIRGNGIILGLRYDEYALSLQWSISVENGVVIWHIDGSKASRIRTIY